MSFELLVFDQDDVVSLGAEERAGGQLDLHGADYLTEFRLEQGLPVWRFQVRALLLEKASSAFPSAEHGARQLSLHRSRPAPAARVAAGLPLSTLRRPGRRNCRRRFTRSARGTAVTKSPIRRPRCRRSGCACMAALPRSRSIRAKFTRSFTARNLSAATTTKAISGVPASFHARTRKSTRRRLSSVPPKSWDIIDVLTPDAAQQAEHDRRARLLDCAVPAARSGIAAELVFAADQFVITPAGRAEEEARAHAAGDEVRTVIAGYHWFTDWGRDTMISLEGLTITTGRHARGRLHPAHLRALRPRRA